MFAVSATSLVRRCLCFQQKFRRAKPVCLRSCRLYEPWIVIVINFWINTKLRKNTKSSVQVCLYAVKVLYRTQSRKISKQLETLSSTRIILLMAKTGKGHLRQRQGGEKTRHYFMVCCPESVDLNLRGSVCTHEVSDTYRWIKGERQYNYLCHVAPAAADTPSIWQTKPCTISSSHSLISCRFKQRHSHISQCEIPFMTHSN